jgi:hypothetical protein
VEGVWVPTSASEVEEAAARGDLEETHTFDAKAALPSAKKNADLAVDVDAMTVDGGSILYGLGEDKDGRLTVLKPIELNGARERVDQIVQTSIAEPPFIRVHALPTEADPTIGYLLVVVPQSARAPHQVISNKDMRYYGRGPTGNRILSEGEVAALYARRKTWEADRSELLKAELDTAPEPDPRLGYVVAYARPVVPDDSMVERAAASAEQVKELLLSGAQSWGHVRVERGNRDYDPDLRKAKNIWRNGTAGWRLSTMREDDGDNKWTVHTARLDLDFDGTGHFFCGRIADTTPQGQLVFFDTILAGNLASFFAAMGALYEAAGYVGHVDIGVAVTGIEGAAPWLLHQWGDNRFSGPVPERTTRVSAAEIRDDPKGVTLSLIGRLLVATRGDPNYIPFEKESDQ